MERKKASDFDPEVLDLWLGRLKEVGSSEVGLSVEKKYFKVKEVPDWIKG